MKCTSVLARSAAPVFIVAVIDSRSRITVRTGIIGKENQADVYAETLINAIRKYGPPDFLICDQHCHFKPYINCCASRFAITLLLHSPFQHRTRTPIQKILRSKNFNRKQFSGIEHFNRKLHAAVEVHNRKIDAEIEKNLLDNKIKTLKNADVQP